MRDNEELRCREFKIATYSYSNAALRARLPIIIYRSY